jgi:two-component system, LytTR family, response regulator LytT
MKVVIIEDEKITAKDLKRTVLAAEPDAEVVAMLHSVEEALAYFKQHTDMDLIFSDIQLGDGLSFDIFSKVEIRVPIIFCTAFDNYYLEAFEATGIDYIMKPFNKAAIEKALAKYTHLAKTFNRQAEAYKNQLNMLETKLNPRKTAVIIRHREKIIPLEAAAIAVFYIENGCTYAHTFAQEKFMVSETLEELEMSFIPAFFRANRQYLVNRKAIKDASLFFNRKMIVNLSIPFNAQILVGKLKTTPFLEWLAQH